MRTDAIHHRLLPGGTWATLAALLLLGSMLGGCNAEPRVEFDNARVRALIPGQDKTVAYLDLHNATPAPVTLIGAVAEDVRAIEFHTTRMEDGIMRMRRLPEVTVGPGETIHFQPGGRHLMLFGVRSLEQTLQIELHFADDTATTLSFEQIAIGAQ